MLLCDEPTGALDYPTGKLVLEVIARINAELGTTAVVITHNVAIAGMADRVIHLADGRIARIDVNAHKLTPVGAVLVKALDRKLLRDLWLMWSQVVTIALVVASGIGGFAGSLATVLLAGRWRASDSTQSARFADCLRRRQARAARRSSARIAAIPGVADVQTTVVST